MRKEKNVTLESMKLNIQVAMDIKITDIDQIKKAERATI